MSSTLRMKQSKSAPIVIICEVICPSTTHEAGYTTHVSCPFFAECCLIINDINPLFGGLGVGFLITVVNILHHKPRKSGMVLYNMRKHPAKSLLVVR